MLRDRHLPRDLKVRTGVDYEFLDGALAALANPERLRILPFLTRARHVEEVATQMGVSRQAAAKHLDRLAAAGLVERRESSRASGPVTEFLVDPRALFLVRDELEKMGALRRQAGRRVAPVRTLLAAEAAKGGPPPASPCFHVVRGADPGARHVLGHNERRAWTLGRDPDCDVVLDQDPYASSRHAEVRWESLPAGFVVADLGSTNRTFRNWEPLPRQGTLALRHGDVVGVGKTLLLFWEPGARPGGG